MDAQRYLLSSLLLACLASPVVAQESTRDGYDGAAVKSIELGDPNGRKVFQPEHPMAMGFSGQRIEPEAAGE